MLTYDTRIKLTKHVFKITDTKKTISWGLTSFPKFKRLKMKLI